MATTTHRHRRHSLRQPQHQLLGIRCLSCFDLLNLRSPKAPTTDERRSRRLGNFLDPEVGGQTFRSGGLGLGHGLRPFWGKAWSLRSSRGLWLKEQGASFLLPFPGMPSEARCGAGSRDDRLWGWDKLAGFPLIPVAHFLEHISEGRL